MIFRILLKDPDGVYESIKDLDGFDKETGSCTSGIEMALSKFVSGKEYIEIEIDTYSKTARVVPNW